uniref:Disease resistance N-terminal domain-containing protein n=1 Tax=Fagus sylvatica TaxID=28930 RepID=A0A2N9IAL1_FAGSY
MAEIVNEIVSDIAVKVLEELGSRFFQELSSAWVVRSDLEKLKDTVSAIKAVVSDADRKKATDHRLNDWIGKLKLVLHDANNVLGKVECSKKVRFFSGSNPLVFRFKMAHKIQDIMKRLDDIAADKSRFNLAEQLED